MKFEELPVRQEAGELYDQLHSIFEKKQFRHYYFKDKILRAALSISNNIAGGYERNTDKELIYFLYVAKGSSGEVKSMLYRAHHAKFISPAQFEAFKEKCSKISAMLHELIQSICKECTQ